MTRRGDPRNHLALLEMATYAEKRVHQQVVRDVVMTWMARRVVPEVVVLVLHPRGRIRVQSREEAVSPLGTTRLAVQWRVVELWEQSATDLLATGDIGLVPLAPLAKFAGPPQTLLRACKTKIDAEARSEEHDSLLVVTQILASLRFDQLLLQSNLSGGRAMTEFPLIVELQAKRSHKIILAVLEARFGEVSEEVIEAVTKVTKEKKLLDITKLAATCKDLHSFLKRLKA